MAEATIPVDLSHFGQVAACIGLMEISAVLTGRGEGRFSSNGLEGAFTLVSGADEDLVKAAIAFLREAEVSALAPAGSDLSGMKIPLLEMEVGQPFSGSLPSSTEALPILLTLQEQSLQVGYWADQSSRDNAKFWTGGSGRAGGEIWFEKMQTPLRSGTPDPTDPFSFSAPMSNGFRLDHRRDYVPIDLGFSPNNHKPGAITMVGYPLVEMLAAIGLSHARPKRHDKFNYSYGVLVSSEKLPLNYHRAALGRSQLPFEMRHFAMMLKKPSETGEYRCITDIIELQETAS